MSSKVTLQLDPQMPQDKGERLMRAGVNGLLALHPEMPENVKLAIHEAYTRNISPTAISRIGSIGLVSVATLLVTSTSSQKQGKTATSGGEEPSNPPQP